MMKEELGFQSFVVTDPFVFVISFSSIVQFVI